MTQINPFTGAIIQSGQVQPRQSAEKDRQIRRTQNLGKNSALQGDRLEHQVESSDALHPSDDGSGGGQPQRKKPQITKKKDARDGREHVDVRA